MWFNETICKKHIDKWKMLKKLKVMDLYSAFQTGYALPKVLYM